ncbi:MAG: PilZ domain-containing protein [Thiotrichaceae bacterium]|nr:PilZ domain-containing protein [Thiotrichaceae bacterium]PCI11153.1 MAG: hypothetical protein COB71_12000 [Thiotrichales bacterium]PCI12873.1 MAG: hypothetical protein COB71_07705 [Thiotrichales bacterium]
MSQEQRRFPRTALNEETIYFLQLDKRDSNERIYSPATILDVSKGGLGMQVGIPHEIDDELWLEGIEGFTGAQAARVKWVKNTKNEELYSIGVAFEGV